MPCIFFFVRPKSPRCVILAVLSCRSTCLMKIRALYKDKISRAV
uniref:Uncharacterized protein n=1 Tax=Anguilla anguilla TaxID=7936 RepID=A0A0E9UR33_ANGAN